MRSNPIPLIALLLLFSLFSAGQSSSQQEKNSRYSLRLKSGSFIPQKNITADKLEQFNPGVAARSGGKIFAVLQFENIPTPEEKKQLQQAGIELLEYIPNNAYTVTITGSLNTKLLTQVKARAIVELSPQQKMETGLAKGSFPPWAVKVPGTIDVWISIPQSFNYETVVGELQASNFQIISDIYKNYRIVGLRIASTRLNELASKSFVEYVQPVPHEDQPLNYNSMFTSRANMLKAPLSVGGRSLKGSGVVVGIGDNGDVQTHVDFSGRIISRAAQSLKAHATHVTGTVGGAGIIEELFTGYAPKATLVNQFYSNIVLFAPTYVKDYGMVVTNNSYGTVVGDCEYNGFYDLASRIVDQQAFDLPELQQVFSAGNDGTLNCSPYPAGFKTVLGGFQSAKNILTVGSTNYKSDISFFSSKGPVKDGRIKPEIMSQGQFVISTWANNAFYSSNNGTSMAAPGVSGGLALLIERYRQLHSGANPPNALLKALLCNGGTDKGNAGPDYSYGFGVMNLLRSVTMIEKSSYFKAAVTNNSNNTHPITVPANTAQLKVTLYWQDPPANLLAAKTLVNDLDLEVTSSSTSTTVFPKILDTIPGNVTAVATTGADHLNNIEQVVINNPAAGNYSLKIKGTAITQNPSQEYFLVYDAIPVDLILTNPVGAEALTPTVSAYDSLYIQWESYGDPVSTFKLEFSSNNGTSWSTINDAIPDASRIYNWGVPAIATEQARIRLTKNSTGITRTSFSFTILNKPVDSLPSNQCEGYINLGWRNVTGATDYEVMMLRGDEMVSVATTTALNYSFSGLSKDTLYWVTVRPRINGIPGRRATAISRQPLDGNCTGNISDNDLKIDAILSPATSGRKFTSTELSNSVPITMRIKNLDDQVSTDDIVVTYSINGGTPVSALINSLSIPSSTITAGGFIDYTFPVNANLAAVGSYSINITATKSSDPVITNNSLIKIYKQLDNQPINFVDLPWLDNFETTPVQSISNRQMGLNGRDRYDYVNSTIYGRLRTFVNSGIANSGNNALTLDAYRFYAPGNNDSLTGTFNLAAFNAATKNMRLDFQYKNHGQVNNAANKVWIRANDTSPWIEAYNLFANQNAPGTFKRSASIELSRILLDNSLNFSSSFQVRWGQNGNNQAADNDGAAGYTFDDIQLYEVTNDMQMLSVDNPVGYYCGLGAGVPVRVTIRNSNNYTVNNVPIKFRIDNGSFLPTETISSIAANTTLQYTFTATADLSVSGSHTVTSVVSYSGDSFSLNDTASVLIINQPIISTYPYLQDFETGNGAWFTLGKYSSWEYGTPTSPKLNRAASGTKAWKTSIGGYYNDMELSYLYSPCFNVSGMTKPTLSASIALDIEDCGSSLCDAAWVEYSTDGISWIKLGAFGQGTNWYNKNYGGNQLWSQQNYTRWHVATTALPTINNSSLRLRFVLSSDAGVVKDGIAIDDIHVYDNTKGIYDITGTSPVVNLPSVNGTGWVDFVEPVTNKLIASINANGQNLGSTNVQSFINTGAVRTLNNYYYHNRNITIKPTKVNLTDSATVRFYFLDTETEALINATGCSNCSKPKMAYELGVSKYSHKDDNIENGTVDDNTGNGNWLFITPGNVKKVPFDKGYYTEFKVKDFSEFWLNTGGFDNTLSQPVELLSFTAKKIIANNVLLEWITASEFNVKNFEIQVARGNDAFQSGQFDKIGEVNSLGNSISEQRYSFTDSETGKLGVRYYRLKINDKDGSFKYSEIKSLLFEDNINWVINPNPSAGMFNLVYQANDGVAITVKVFDVMGRAVRMYSSVATGFEQKINIDLTEPKFAKGLYLMEVIAADKKQSFKLIKQ